LTAAFLLALTVFLVNLKLCIPVGALNFSNYLLLAKNMVVSPLNLFSLSDKNKLNE
jgi:hypothetical protein